ncbi:MAG: PAAR domain-containing protein [Pirellulales bacterium]|nr:PAAR domain-containing protein [Pirellulales bacterium]
MPPAARLSDMHICSQVTSDVPHVGGPIVGPGAPTVLVEGLPAACVGDEATCTGPPDALAVGSATVLIGGSPAVRMGDSTEHGGSIIAGAATVMIGG